MILVPVSGEKRVLNPAKSGHNTARVMSRGQPPWERHERCVSRAGDRCRMSKPLRLFSWLCLWLPCVLPAPVPLARAQTIEAPSKLPRLTFLGDFNVPTGTAFEALGATARLAKPCCWTWPTSSINSARAFNRSKTSRGCASARNSRTAVLHCSSSATTTTENGNGPRF